MKIKLQDYSLISNEWIDQQLKQLEVYIDTDKEMMSIYNAMCYVKKQLIPSEKLADVSFDKGKLMVYPKSYGWSVDKEDFLTSEIELL